MNALGPSARIESKSRIANDAMADHPRPSLRDSIDNYRKEGRNAFGVALGLLANGWNRLSKRQGCCGDYGAPGC